MTLKYIRALKAIKQEYLAEILEVSQASVSRWETGKATPNLSTMQKLAEVLEVDLQTIVDCFSKYDKKEEE